MYSEILLPTDAGDGTERATDHALGIADRVGARVHAVHVVDETTLRPLSGEAQETLHDASRAAGRNGTARIAELASERGIDALREHRDGTPHEVLSTYAGDAGIDLVVMATRSRPDARRRLGSTTERVVRHSPAPVLAVPVHGDEQEPPKPEYDDVLVPTDGSAPAERAAERAVALAERYDATVHAIYVVDEAITRYGDAPRSIVGPLKEAGRRSVDEIAELADDAGLSSTTAVRRGTPYRELLDRREQADADVIAMGTRGRTGTPAVLLGSTTARMLRRSPVPVLASR